MFDTDAGGRNEEQPVTFIVYTLNGHERMPLEKVFKKRMVEKTAAIVAARPIEEQERHGASEQRDQPYSVAQACRAVEHLPANPPVLLAEQVMTVPVVTLTAEASITDALRQFHANAFRHVPVVSSAGTLVGIVSERDILRAVMRHYTLELWV
jgi:CBS-domain-containing membrane protein